MDESYLDLYPYHKGKWPLRSPAIHTGKGMICLIGAVGYEPFVNEFRSIAKPIPRNVAIFLAPTDPRHEGVLTQVCGGEPLQYAFASEIIDVIKGYLKAPNTDPMIDEAWLNGQISRIRKLGRSRPVILYFG
jgi:hypothetical protein